MPKRTYRHVQRDILLVLSDGKEHSYGGIERKADTNWQTVREHCAVLELFGAVTISKEARVRITLRGRTVLKKL